MVNLEPPIARIGADFPVCRICVNRRNLRMGFVRSELPCVITGPSASSPQVVRLWFPKTTQIWVGGRVAWKFGLVWPWSVLNMPTILRSGPYRFFFYASDGNEPLHIHIQREAALAKFWLYPVRLAGSSGYSRKELRALARLVRKEQLHIERSWHAFFGDA